MTDANGNTVNLSSFKGKKVFVNLSTWCPPCRAEIPSIENLASKVDKEKAVFIMLSLDENFEVAKKFAKFKTLKFLYIILLKSYRLYLIPMAYLPLSFFNENGDW